MGRPLNLDPVPVAGGARASLPVERGSTKRKTYTFTRGGDDVAATNARTWLIDGAAALAAGRALPEPSLYDRAPVAAESFTERRTLAAAVGATLHRRYEINGLAQPRRAAELKAKVDNILLPWFNARAANGQTMALDELTQPMVRAFVQHLAGGDIAIDDDGELWLNETALDLDVAAALANCQLSQLRRAAADAGLDLSSEDARISAATLAHLGLLEVRHHPEAFGYVRRYAADLLRVLNWAIVDAVGAGQLRRDVTHGIAAIEPVDAVRRRPPDAEKRRPLRLSEARRVFSHLHLVHLVVALLQRFCGPRIGEAYGPRVRDLVDHRSFGLLRLVEQGGSQFLDRDDRGRLQTVSRKNRLKTPQSRRVLVVPGHLMPLLRLIIDVFHTDPETGVVDLDARLVPGITVDGEAGAAGYRDALRQAFAAERLSYETLGFHPKPHWLRQSLATDLKNQPELAKQSVKRVLGHQPGDEVSDIVYYLDDPENLAPFKAIAEAIDNQIERQLGDLLMPTRLPDFGRGHPIRARVADVQHVLTEAGWLASDVDGPDTTQWAIDQLQLDYAWTLRSSARVEIAIVDSGIDATRPDLAGRVATGFDAVTGRTIPAGANSAFEPHGTAVAGIVAGTRGNGVEVAGVNSGAIVRPYRVMGHNGPCVEEGALAAALDHIATVDSIRIVNMSVGGPQMDPAIRDAVRRVAAAGKILIAASGNDGGGGARANYPASYPEVIAVGATGPGPRVAPYSQTANVEFVAPGGVGSTRADGIATMTVWDGLEFGTGTSYAAPYIAGAVSLWLDGNRATTDEARKALRAAAVDIAGTTADGYGLLDVAALLRGSSTAQPKPTPVARDTSDVCDQQQRDSFADAAGNVHEYAIRCIVGWGITQGRTDGTYGPAADVTRGQVATFLVRTLEAAGATLPATARDAYSDDGGDTHEASLNRLAAVGIPAVRTPTVRPKAAATRAEMAEWVTAAVRYAGGSHTDRTNWYSDDDGHRLEAHVNDLSGFGVVTGKGGGLYGPDESLTRAQMATFLSRALSLAVEAAG